MKWQTIMIVDHGVLRHRENFSRMKVPGGWIARHIDYTGRKGPVRHATVYIPGNEKWDVRKNPVQREIIINRKSPDYNEQTYRFEIPEGWIVMECFYPAGKEQSHISLVYIPDEEHQWKKEESYETGISAEHTLFPFVEQLRQHSSSSSLIIRGNEDNGTVHIGGIVRDIRETIDERNQVMASVLFEDLEGFIEVIFSPVIYKKYHSLIHGKDIIIIMGDVQKTDGEKIIVAREVELLPTNNI